MRCMKSSPLVARARLWIYLAAASGACAGDEHQGPLDAGAAVDAQALMDAQVPDGARGDGASADGAGPDGAGPDAAGPDAGEDAGASPEADGGSQHKLTAIEVTPRNAMVELPLHTA